MHADVHAREGYGGCKHIEKPGEAWERERQHRRCGEARRCVAGWERRVMREGHESLRFRVTQGWTRTVGERLQPRRRQVRDRNRDQCEGEDAPAAIERAQHDRNDDPEEPEPAGVREPFEDRIQPARAMADYPALEVPVERDQAGTICFVCSINARRAHGLLTKPCAPRITASSPASSWPLNITAGIEPTLGRSRIRLDGSQ